MNKNWLKKKKQSNMNRHANLTESDGIEKEADNVAVEDAKQRIQNFFLLQAWRLQKQKTSELNIDVKNLTSQVESLKLQIYTLKQLLDAEKARVVHVNADLRVVLNALEECKNEKKLLIKDKELLGIRIQAMEEKMTMMENEFKNQKNELITAKTEAQNWEKQLDKEREKICKMKDEKKYLLEEVRFKGNLLVWQIRSFEQFSRLFNVRQGKPFNPALPWDGACGRNDPEPEVFSRREKNPKKQEAVILVEKPREIQGLKAILAKAERKTTGEDGKTEEREKSILEKTWVALKNY